MKNYGTRRVPAAAQLLALATLAYLLAPAGRTLAQAPRGSAPQEIHLGRQLSAKRLRAVNREVTPLAGRPDGVHVSEAAGPGVVWIEGAQFASGTIELSIRGKDVLQRSFVGVAFNRTADDRYEAVYLRPFNFRADDPSRRQHAVQYISLPDYDWPRLRSEFPEKFESPVDGSVSPADWFSVRLIVSAETVRVYVGRAEAPALEVRRLGQARGGMIGLWVGNNSDGDFAGLRVTPAEAK